MIMILINIDFLFVDINVVEITILTVIFIIKPKHKNNTVRKKKAQFVLLCVSLPED